MIPLTGLQSTIMREFYSHDKLKVIYNKGNRNEMWKLSTKRDQTMDFDSIKEKCPALEHQIKKSYESGRNIQSAVFSECVYAQTFANLFSLPLFVNCYEQHDFLPENIMALLKSLYLVPRYVYSNTDKSKILIQAGGCDGIDSALITVFDLNVYTIEFKEPSAKTSEPDLPKYKEDGNLLVTEDFLSKYPQFKEMLKEQTAKKLNFFSVMGSNVNDFSKDSINIAVTNNYTNKYATVVCTEDVDGYLVMIPTNHISQWADIEGEIRPAGRNHYNVWTPIALNNFLKGLGASFNGEKVTLDTKKLDVRKERGGDGKISGYKINPLFFVYSSDCKENGDFITFDISKVQQLNPTIAGKIFFKTLKYDAVKEYYELK